MVTEGQIPVIRHLTLDDLDDSLRLSSTAGWNQQRADWQMLLTTAPAGSFGAIDSSSERIVGTAIGIDYGSFGWIAMMLVDPANRSRGLGAQSARRGDERLAGRNANPPGRDADGPAALPAIRLRRRERADAACCRSRKSSFGRRPRRRSSR